MSLIKRIKIIVNQTINDLRYNIHHYRMHTVGDEEIQYATLRMYCHMLDKGMNNPHFEKGHSLPIYRKAIELRDKLRNKYEKDVCFEWVGEILSRFNEAQQEGKPNLLLSPPVSYTDSQIKEYTNFLKRRTSCRNFKDQHIPSDVISKIIELAADAPNGCCRQVVRYYITQNKIKVEKLIPHVAGITNFSNIQCMVCVAAEASYYDLQDKYLQYVDASLSAENFILAASLYGIYGTMCNFFHATKDDVSKCKKELGLKETENIVMFIAIGYPIAIPEKPLRRNLDVFYKEV